MCQTHFPSRRSPYPRSSVIRKMQIKTTVRHSYVLITLPKNKNELTIPSAGEVAELLELSHIFGRNVK